ncbi:hypothetical protein MtrunA17_Chr3g0105211 [Medicago truncatula]|uniref:Transmembrane protein n=1 Tax=Medicago truncatula TaxID=3880 RepID=A0A396ITH8_MEDTR|nr:uncharacterized protein LOC112419902 [Medicago truncatula]RHN67674.1 hypothetical protein MtrunA17_Chr3g0105211 [Medicago truncatula]
MAFEARSGLYFSFFFLFLLCSARARDPTLFSRNQNSQYEIDDYGPPRSNPGHDPRKPPPTPVYNEENYEGIGAKPKHDPHSATTLMSEGTVLEPSKLSSIT